MSACATTGVALDREHAPRARVTLAPLLADDTVRVIPQAIEPMLPSADRLAHIIRRRLGDTAKVGVRYCVAPAGHVVYADLAERSPLPAFDQAVMTDIVEWRFATRPGPAEVKTCQLATIIYRPRG